MKNCRKMVVFLLVVFLALGMCACNSDKSSKAGGYRGGSQPKTMEEVLTGKPWRSTFIMSGATCHKIYIFHDDGTVDFTMDFGGEVADYTTTDYTIEDDCIMVGGVVQIDYTFYDGTLILNIVLDSGKLEELVQYDG